jgi:hypothetical protein
VESLSEKTGFLVFIGATQFEQSSRVVAFLRNTSVSELAKQTRCESNGFFVFKIPDCHRLSSS